MKKESTDNLSVVLLAFKNLQNYLASPELHTEQGNLFIEELGGEQD